MKSIFLSHDEVFTKPLSIFDSIAPAAPASDLAKLTAVDDGFLMDGVSINYFLSDFAYVDRFGRGEDCSNCAVRPVLLLEEGDVELLEHRAEDEGLVTVEFGRFPYQVLDESLRELAGREYKRGALPKAGFDITIAGKACPVYRLGAKEIICVNFADGGVNGFVRLSDATVVAEGEDVFLEMRPVRWLYDEKAGLLVSCMALFAGYEREAAAEYLDAAFLEELCFRSEAEPAVAAGFTVREHV